MAPDAGSSVNETDYHEPDWQRSFWGDNYARLLEIKHTYNRGNLFRVHHGVGSGHVLIVVGVEVTAVEEDELLGLVGSVEFLQ